MKPLIFYAQNREDIILKAFFDDTEKGFYVDVGAHHPIYDSVTKLFYENGWHGINIEPQQKMFTQLVKDRKRDINLQIGVSDKPGELTLRSYESSGLSTFSEEQKQEYEKNPYSGTDEFTEHTVMVETLATIFKKHNVKKIQFLKVDVEGYEEQVLVGNDWGNFRPEVLCIEANHIKKDWRPLLNKQGYIFAFFDGLNEYYVDNESEYRIELFKRTYPELLVAAPLLSIGWSEQINRLVRRLEKVQKQLDRVQDELDRQSAEREDYVQKLEDITMAHKELKENTRRPKYLMKTLALEAARRLKR